MALPLIGAAITAAMVAGAARVAVAAIGFGVVTFAGANIMLSQALNSIQSDMGATGSVAAIAGLAGLDRAISIIVGSFSARIALIPLKRLMLM